MKTLRIVPRLALLLLALASTAVAAHAQNGTPQSPYVITTAPYTITTSGYYILGNNINCSNDTNSIITVNASNVTIDFNGFYIAGPVGNTSQSLAGIYANERSNITITNGTIAYCLYGIDITGNGTATTNNVGHRISQMRVTYCYGIGIEVDNAPGTLIEKNQISQIGGSTYAFPFTCGIFASRAGSTVADNVITTVKVGAASNSAFGIKADAGSFVVRNTVDNAPIGINCSGKYQNNLTYGCPTPFSNSGGTDAGGNN